MTKAQQKEQMKTNKGFIAALDQSGGSTPKALGLYGIDNTAYSNDEEMFNIVHEMRTRIIKSPSFTSDKIIGSILFENTMDRTIDGKPTANYLWENKKIVPFIKIDKGLADIENGVQLMKDNPTLDQLLTKAKQYPIFGTKERSVIHEFNTVGIAQIVDQQFEIGKQVLNAGLVPILEPEVDIHANSKDAIEEELLRLLLAGLNKLSPDEHVIFKLTIPTVDDLYLPLIEHPNVIRVVALSGGYSQVEACQKLARNHGLIASFSRAFSQGLHVHQDEVDFDEHMSRSIDLIYNASII